MKQRKKAPGRSHRKGLTVVQAVRKFSDDEAANDWFVERRWPDGVRCAYCGSDKVTRRKASKRRKTPAYRCNPCKRNFTVKTGTIMHDSKLPVSTWALAFYLMSTNLKGVSSMKLHRDLGITQKAAWHLAHRIRETWNEAPDKTKMITYVEVDETYVGGKERNKHASKKHRTKYGKPARGRGTGKTPVIGAKDRVTGKIAARPIDSVDFFDLNRFVIDSTHPAAVLYTDEWRGYNWVPRLRQTVKHGAKEYVDGMVHTNGIESFWALMKRGFNGTYHKLSVKHLPRYVNEFAGRHNQRPLDTIEQMAAMAQAGLDKRLTYAELIGPPETRQPKML